MDQQMDAKPIDQDLYATWPQLMERLREIRKWAEDDYGPAADAVLAILDRPRETADGNP